MTDYKRMLLAVLIASLFIFLWTSVFVKPKRRTPQGEPTAVADSVYPGAVDAPAREERRGTGAESPPEASRERRETPLPGTIIAEGGGVDFPAVSPEDRRTRPAVVETDICRGTIAPIGGGLASWKLLDFLDLNDETVDLVNKGLGISSELDVELVLGSGPVNFQDAPFSIETVSSSDPAVEKKLRLTAADTSGASLTKTYTFYKDEYFFDLDVEAGGFGSEIGLACALSWRHGVPITEANQKTDLHNFAAVTLVGEEHEKDKIKDFNKEPSRSYEGSVFWTGVRNKYFIAAIIPTEGPGKAVHTWGTPDRNQVGTQLLTQMAPGGAGGGTASFRVYGGPIDYDLLSPLDVGLERSVYQRFQFMTPLNHLIFAVMKWFYKFLPNYGVVIIIVSALSKLVFYPLTKSSLKSMAAMRKLQPEIQALKQKYKGDPKKMNQAQMELFRKHKVNPMGGCLPILVQMPIFFALYNVLVESVAFRRAPFVLWIDDLSAPDTLFYVGTFPIHVLPIVMAVTQLLQPQMGGADPRQAMMTKIMPVFLLVIFYGLPSGLVLYWTINNVMTALQQYIMNRQEAAKEAAAGAVTAPAPAKGNPNKRPRGSRKRK
jgi:YidC/Oxa1 family membrane protein insertase